MNALRKDEFKIDILDKQKSIFLSKTQIVDAITKYQLYYHISLGNFVYETFLDLGETVQKVQELNLHISINKTLNKITQIFLQHSNEKEFNKNFEEYIKKQAMIDALDDFVKKDKDLLNKKYYYNQKLDDIKNKNYFNEQMQYNFETNYQKAYEYYNFAINKISPMR